MNIRPALPRDAAALAELQESIYREGRWFVGDGGVAPEALARRLRSLDPKRSLWLLAAAGGEPVAWLELHRMVPSRLDHVASLTLAVAKRWRRHGLGRRLLHACYPWAERVGVRKIRLDVRAGNAAAVALYRAEGFALEGRERDQVRVGGGFEDNLIMARFVRP